MRILIIEDDFKIADVIASRLRNEQEQAIDMAWDWRLLKIL